MEKDLSSEKLKTEFSRQWNQVVSKCPLVAAALLLQDQDYSKVVSEQLSSTTIDLYSLQYQANDLVIAYGESSTITSVGERYAHALRELFKDLARATSDGDIRTAFETFGRRWCGEDDRVEIRVCPDCGGIDSDDCSRCGGTGEIWL